MNFIIENWYIIIGILAVLIVGGLFVYKFLGLPTKEQIGKIKEWLLYAVIEAEKELGSGTGEIKLRSVYSVFIVRFPLVAKLISFETFSLWVDEALHVMRNMLDENDNVLDYVEGVSRIHIANKSTALTLDNKDIQIKTGSITGTLI